MFTAEIDHKDKEHNQYSHKNGGFKKKVRALSTTDGDAAQTIRHAEELYNAINDAHQNSLKCKLLLVKGTKYGTSEGGIKGAVDGDNWVVTNLSGGVSEGFEFTLERTA